VGYLSPKVENWNGETIFTGSIGLYSTIATYLASKVIEFDEKTQNKGYYAVQGRSRSFKVIEVNLSRTVAELSQLIVQIVDNLRF